MPTLHHSSRGSAEPAVILLHGFPLDARMWDAQIEALSAKYRVITPDLPGSGKSLPPRPFSMESAADDVRALAAEVLGAGTRFVLGGLSMGGYIALAYARRHADTLRGLMLIDTKAEADTAEGRLGRDKMISLVREKGAAAVGEVMVPKLIAPVKARPQLVKQLRAMTDSASPATIEQALVAMKGRADQSPYLGQMKVPTLVIVGEVDALTPPEVAEGMAKKLPQAEMVVIRGAGHMSPMEQPEQVNAAMLRFLETV